MGHSATSCNNHGCETTANPRRPDIVHTVHISSVAKDDRHA